MEEGQELIPRKAANAVPNATYSKSNEFCTQIGENQVEFPQFDDKTYFIYGVDEGGYVGEGRIVGFSKIVHEFARHNEHGRERKTISKSPQHSQPHEQYIRRICVYEDRPYRSSFAFRAPLLRLPDLWNFRHAMKQDWKIERERVFALDFSLSANTPLSSRAKL